MKKLEMTADELIKTSEMTENEFKAIQHRARKMDFSQFGEFCQELSGKEVYKNGRKCHKYVLFHGHKITTYYQLRHNNNFQIIEKDEQ